MLSVVGYPNVARRVDRSIDRHLHAAALVTAGWGDRIAGLHAGRAGVLPRAAEFCGPGAKLETQTWSSPSVETAQAPQMLPELKGVAPKPDRQNYHLRRSNRRADQKHRENNHKQYAHQRRDESNILIEADFREG